ncbi:hypothetical protein WSM22_19700 [Cytophagales bacterium WSM2-2]|nr:hypothetical protein WSM22_19700 [Cytophagales bacterium WSM2-2]
MKKIIVSLILTATLVTSCVDNLKDYNIDQKRASSVPPATLFANAVRNLIDVLNTPNVNTNNFRLYVQQWATVTYTSEPRYDLTTRTIPQSFWQAIYRDVIADLKEAKKVITADALLAPGIKANQLAQIEVMELYSWSVLVNTFGNVPYSKAFDPANTLPDYDDAATVYSDLLGRLDAAIAALSSISTGIPAASDLIYSGNIDRWIKFSNSLKLRLAMILADKDAIKAQTLVQQAVTGGLLASNTDNARHPFLATAPNNNLVSNNLVAPFTTRQDFVASKTIVDKMNTLNDPRRIYYFNETAPGVFVGGINGDPNDFATTSHISDKITNPSFEALFMDYAEVEFLLAEAAERGFIPGGAATARTHYNTAVTGSISYWGGTAAAATTYLAQAAVSYTTASGTYKQKIGEQKFLALNNRGYDAWIEWRRLDFPVLTPAAAGLNIPIRLIYPVSEQTQNGSSYAEAVSAMGGSDVTTVKLFWDIF